MWTSRADPHSVSLWITLVVLLSISLPTSSTGQTIRVTVVDQQTQLPVPDAAVTLRDSSDAIVVDGLTDAAGQVLLPALAGRYTVWVRRIGYEAKTSVTLRVRADLEIGEVTMLVSPVAFLLDPVTITGDSAPYAPGPLRSFYQRRRRGWGHFITPEEVELRDPIQVTDLLRQVAGVRLLPRGSTGYIITMSRTLMSLGDAQRAAQPTGFQPRTRASIRDASNEGAGSGKCEVSYYLNGGRFRPDPEVGINQILGSEVIAVEVYRGPSETPAEFLDSSSRCGVIVIWTRRGPRA